MASFTLDYSEIDSLSSAMEQYGTGALREINDVLHGEGGEKIKQAIQLLIPASGRTWKGKKAPASVADALQQVNNEQLAVTIKSRTAYNYLYFPDDGSNTLHHAGGQHFFQSGAEDSADQIVEMCVSKLLENF